ncbi:MAG: DUF975 family protein [Oscillospiraceae bacterium]|nr:DUF975 family protein [Oscillospiraceae bacterium]
MPNRSQIKTEARHLIRTGTVSPLAATAVALLIAFVLEHISDLVEYGSVFFSYQFQAVYLEAVLTGDYSVLPTLLNGGSGIYSPMSLFFTVLVSLFTSVLYGGYYIYCMGIRQGLQMPLTTLADGLSVAGKLIWCNILIGVKTFLWSLLFFIPGVIAAYRYRFAVYNVLTDPSLTAGEAIQLSCRQTYGMKGSLFMLDLSFIGWNLLSSVLNSVFVWMKFYSMAALVSFALQLWVLPYLTFSDLAYFEQGQRRLGRPPYGGNDPYSYGGNSPWEL